MHRIKTNASKRMWRRRAFIAGWLIKDITSLLIAVLIYPFKNGEAFKNTLICAVVLSLFVACSRQVHKNNTIATKEDIEQYVVGNACLIDLVKRRQAQFAIPNDNRPAHPLTITDIETAKDDCEKFQKTANQIFEQKAILNNLGAK